MQFGSRFKKICSLLLATTLCQFGFAENGVYVGAEIGRHITPNIRTSYVDSVNLTTSTGRAVFRNDGYNLGLVLGRKHYQYRYEFDVHYYSQNLDTLFINEAATANTRGALHNTTAMVNLYYEWQDRDPDWAPYIGLGVGAINSKLNGSNSLSTNAATISSINFAYQGIVGISFRLDNRTDLNLDYRHMRSFGMPISISDSGANRISARRAPILQHIVQLGLIYRV